MYPNGQTPWRSRAHGVWFRLCEVCLSFYVAYVVFLAHSRMFLGRLATGMSLMCFAAISVGVYGLLEYMCEVFCRVEFKARKRQRLDYRVLALAFALAMGVFGSAFLACYPGGVNYDISNQWHQAHTGEYNSWHPLLHTLMMTGLTRIFDSYPFALLFQITVFALALSYLTAVLNKYGVPAWLALMVHTLVAASLPVRNTLMYLGKDSAMTIGVIVLTAQAVEILYTRGEWLKKPLHVILMGLMLAYVTLIRINALLWTIPLMACILFAFRVSRKQAICTAVVMAAALGVVQGPLYGMLDVVHPHNLVEESIGLPMTILGDIKRTEPYRLKRETSQFLNKLATPQEWREVYQLHNYNSIKFTFERELIAETPVQDILRMSYVSAKNAPRTAFKAFNGLTDLVWDVTGKDEGYQHVRNSGDIESVQYSNTAMNQLGSSLCGIMDSVMALQPLRWLTRNIGVQMLILLLVTLWALYRRGTAVLMLAVPTLLYNLGTMLLLCGNDARFFQFSMTVSLPAILALLFWPDEEEKACR